MSNPKNHLAVDWNALELLGDAAPSSLSWSSVGPDGSGKSDFALSAPGPIFVAAFDAYGLNRVRRERKQHKEIRIARYYFTPPKHATKNEIGDAAMAFWNKFVADYREALKHVRTVIWDREDMAWELLRFASFGAQNDAPKEYGPLHTEYTSLIQEAAAAGVNLGLLQGVRDKWVSKLDPQKGKLVPHNTGEKMADGWAKVPDMVDVTLAHRWDTEQRAYMTKLGKFPNKDEKDKEYPDLDWPLMAMSAYPESSPEDWGIVL